MVREVRIDSYFSLEADLASEMRTWPEFVAGKGYECVLQSDSETVETKLESDDGKPYVLIHGEGTGKLFSCVLGAVLWTMAGCSDDVWPRVMRWGLIEQS